MREMKDSGVAWIGKIPTKWTIAKAKNCVEIQNGSDPKTEGSIPVYGSGSMSFKTCGEYKEGPSVLIGRKGATLHIPHYISSKFWNVDTAFNVYSKSIFDLKYYFYCAHVFDYKLYMSQTTLPSMTQTAYENMFLPLPTKEEQCAIANQLDQVCAEIDAVLEKTRASIEEYKKLKQAVITQAVTKGVRGDRPMKDSGIEWIGEIPKEWKRTKIKMVAFFFNGDRTSRYPQPADFVDDGVAFLTSRNIDGDEVNLSETKYITENKYRSLSGAKIQIDDIVFCLRGSVGKCALNRALSCGTVASSLATIRPKNIYPKYFLYFLLSNIASTQTAIFMNGTCAANLSAENVANYYIVLPCSAEQKEIADYLDDKCEKINALIAKKQQYLTEIENYKKSLIYEYVTGKKEVHPL